MPRKRRRRSGPLKKEIERLEEYLYIQRTEALDIISKLDPKDKTNLNNFFTEFYNKETLHYWSITKLFVHAAYIPIFLQIGRKHFDRLVYIDTHSGPGIAKIWSGEEDVIIGSPLIALRWPSIVAEKVKQFKNINKGFDKLYFIDKDEKNINLLRKKVNIYDSKRKVNLYAHDANTILPIVITRELKNASKRNQRILFYIFADPFGNVNAQLKGDTLKESLGTTKADVIMSIFDMSLARSFQGKPNKELASLLFGNGYCEEENEISQRICFKGNPSRNDIRLSYKLLFEKIGYPRVEFIPVRHEKRIIYHLLIAVKDPTSPWIDAFLGYIRSMIPKPHHLRNLYLKVAKRQSSLDQYFGSLND